MTVENKIEFWKESPITSTEIPIDVSDLLYSAPTEKRFATEVTANDFLFEEPITFQFKNWDGEFYDRLTYTTAYSGGALITTNNEQSASEYKYVLISILRGGVWVKKYLGRIRRNAVESDEVAGVVRIETEALTVALKDTIMAEVADIYNGHDYTSSVNKTPTISGTVKDIVEKIIKHCTGCTTVEFDSSREYNIINLYNIVELGFDDLWFICPFTRASVVDATSCADFLRTCCVIANAVAFTDFKDGELVGYFRAKRRDAATTEIDSEKLIGGFQIQPSFDDYDQYGKAIRSTFTRFDDSTFTNTQKRNSLTSAQLSLANQKNSETIQVVEPFDVGDKIVFETHDTVYKVTGSGASSNDIRPPLKQAVYEGESIFLVDGGVDSSEILFSECFFLKTLYPEIFVASDVGSSGVVKLYNYGSNLQIGYLSTECANTLNDLRGVAVVAGIGCDRSDIDLNSYKHTPGATCIFASNEVANGNIFQLSDSGEFGKTYLNNAIGDIASGLYHFNSIHASVFKRTDDNGDVDNNITLFATSTRPIICRFKVRYDTTLTEDNFDGGTNGKKNYYRLVPDDKDELDTVRLNSTDFTILEAFGGVFVNNDPLNPFGDAYIYFSVKDDGSWYVSKSLAYGSDAVTVVHDFSSISSNIALKQVWVNVDADGQHVWVVGDHSTANDSMIYKDGSGWLGLGVFSTPNLYGVVHDGDCYLDDVQGVCVSYDGYVFFTEKSNKKVCVYDPHTDDIYTIADSSMVDAPYQLACVDFLPCFETGQSLYLFSKKSDITAAAAVTQGLFHATPRRVASSKIMDHDEDVLPLDNLTLSDLVGASSSSMSGLVFELGFDWTTHDYNIYKLVETP